MRWATVLLLCGVCAAQLSVMGGHAVAGGKAILGSSGATVVPITLDATCTGNASSGQTVACSASMTVTAGDTITCEGFATTFSTEDLWFNDPTNGGYDTIYGNISPANTNNWIASAVFANSVGGSITPQVNMTNGTGNAALACQAWKGTPTTNVIDGLATISQSTTAANPTAGTAVAPGNGNQALICALDRATAAATTGGAGFLPGGTLTAVTQSFAHYFQYQIQTGTAAVNCPYTSASAAYVDTQFAVENLSTPAGYRPITGMFGFAGAQSNGATITAAIMNTQGSGSAWSTHGNTTAAPWTFAGAVNLPTWDTSVNPTGTGRIIAEGFAHTFGDAGGSVNFPGAAGSGGAVSFTFTDRATNMGQSVWLGYFVRVGSAGITNTTICDMSQLGGGVTTNTLTAQAHYDTVNKVGIFLENSISGTSPLIQNLNLDTDYFVQEHIASVNERYHEIRVYSKSGTWSSVGSTTYDVLCGTLNSSQCATPPFTGSGTGSASSGSTSLTITSASGTPAVGNVVYPTTGIPYLTAVESITGTCSASCTIVLSQNTNAVVSGTINFVAKPTSLVGATNGTASSGSTALTIVVPLSGTVAGGQSVGSTDGSILAGTYVVSVAGTAVTLSQPAHSAVATGVSFWSASTGPTVTIGKWSSCSFTNPIWYSALTWDPYGSWGAFAPN